YKPSAIGIYGCSAGGLLTAEAVAWFIKEHLPVPGAIGMFCNGAAYWTDGDTGFFLESEPTGSSENAYFRGVEANDPLAFPVNSGALLSRFPPTLLISGTRDWGLSSVVRPHALLRAHGVEADLRVWEGMGHAFLTNPLLPESQEAYEATV